MILNIFLFSDNKYKIEYLWTINKGIFDMDYSRFKLASD